MNGPDLPQPDKPFDVHAYGRRWPTVAKKAELVDGVLVFSGDFDERDLDGDIVTDFGGVGVVVDRMSAPYLKGASIDFVDTIEKQGFTIDNPNAGGSCACGDSFN